MLWCRFLCLLPILRETFGFVEEGRGRVLTFWGVYCKLGSWFPLLLLSWVSKVCAFEETKEIAFHFDGYCGGSGFLCVSRGCVVLYVGSWGGGVV